MRNITSIIENLLHIVRLCYPRLTGRFPRGSSTSSFGYRQVSDCQANPLGVDHTPLQTNKYWLLKPA